MRPVTGCRSASAAVARSKGTPETSIVVRTPSRLDTLKRPSRALSTRAAPQEHASYVHPLHVVQVEHGVLQLRRFEQALLRARVALHVAVIVKMVAREIGEQSRAESDA